MNSRTTGLGGLKEKKDPEEEVSSNRNGNILTNAPQSSHRM